MIESCKNVYLLGMTNQFYQAGPQIQNTLDSDPLILKFIESKVPMDKRALFKSELEICGKKAVGLWRDLSQEAEQNPPRLVNYDPWGRRIDELQISRAWTDLEAEVAREGIIATAYEQHHGEWSRGLQLLKLYLFHPSSAFVSCPLAMTDGAARCLQKIGDDQLKRDVLPHLISRDPNYFWTSGQWMTEKSGGSDVSRTETVATAKADAEPGQYQISGIKWFTSATHSQVAMLLAKVVGSQGLSLFCVETHDRDGNLKDIEILRLKDKLGTRAMPTAELELKNMTGVLLGEIGQGVKNISTILNITRIYNSVCATAHFRRGLDLLKSYSENRWAFGKNIIDQDLHRELLQDLESDWADCFKFTFRLGHLLGKEEVNNITEAEKVELRVMTPLLKLFTAKKCFLAMSEVCEGFGGAGYIEDTGIPRLLRDAQVFSIWEGTTHVMALDFLRALTKEKGAMDWFQDRMGRSDSQELKIDLDNPLKDLRQKVFAISKYYIETISF